MKIDNKQYNRYDDIPQICIIITKKTKQKLYEKINAQHKNQ